MNVFDIFDLESDVDIDSWIQPARDAIWQYLHEKNINKRYSMTKNFVWEWDETDIEYLFYSYKNCFNMNTVIEDSLLLKSNRPRKTKRISEDFRECVLEIFKEIGLNGSGFDIRDVSVKRVTDMLMDKLPNIYEIIEIPPLSKAEVFLVYIFDTLFYMFLQKNVLKAKCHYCGHVIEDIKDARRIDGYYYCKEHSFYCVFHHRYEYIEDQHTYIENFGWVCKDALDSELYKECRLCKKDFRARDVIETEDFGCFCKKCFDRVYTYDEAREKHFPCWEMQPCEWCGTKIHEDDVIIIKSSLFCETCANKLFEIFSAIEDTVECKHKKLFVEHSLDEVTDFGFDWEKFCIQSLDEEFINLPSKNAVQRLWLADTMG